jgi:hypothetical protein
LTGEICTNNERIGGGTAGQYYEEDFDMYEGDLLPGQLWLRGEIGGKRW